ncbi:ATP-dependent DNA helicase [archaeon]|nr:ATP-dependent DNA helicase [archaeon]
MPEKKEKTHEGDAAKYLFPHDRLREIQKDMIEEVASVIEKRGNLVVHAPTGLGKTAATIAPALRYAIDHKKKVFFLTSRHTQHIIAIETLREIKKKYDLDFVAVDLIGKKWMCTVPGIDKLHTSGFYEYCRKQREEGLCEQYSNTKTGSKLTPKAKAALERLEKASPCHTERFSEMCSEDELCAYELAALMAKDAAVVVADYYYIFNPKIRDAFFKRAGIDLSECIVIVDEGHNLPDRIRNLMTTQLSNYMLKRALNEARKLEDEKSVDRLTRIQDVLNEWSQGMKDGDEKLVKRDDFVKEMDKIGDYDVISADFAMAAQQVLEKERQTSIGGVAEFLESWKGGDAGYARILAQKQTKRESVIALSYRCLDPSLVSQSVINSCHSTIIMSGTLTPTSMYKDVLGFPDGTIEKTYPSPFPEKNRLAMIIPETTTKFSMRTTQQYERIAEICSEITNTVPGNCAIFFPSYYLMKQVYVFLSDLSRKTTFMEESEMNKEEKSEFLERFKAYKDSGAVLLGVVSGSFGEGIDLPGKLLNCVVVVGLPLQQPTLETKKLIEYYDAKFAKGWEYGYVGPAFSKCLQSAGRCIRSETDRGVIAFLDERYAWQNYRQHFPEDWEIEITKDYLEKIREFFGKK